MNAESGRQPHSSNRTNSAAITFKAAIIGPRTMDHAVRSRPRMTQRTITDARQMACPACFAIEMKLSEFKRVAFAGYRMTPAV